MGVFPVDPANVPPDAVRALKRTMLRHGQPVDDDLARLLVAMVIAALKVTIDADGRTGGPQ